MPWTHQLFADQIAFAERAAAMRAGVVERVNAAAGAAQRDLAPADHTRRRTAEGDFVDASDVNEFQDGTRSLSEPSHARSGMGIPLRPTAAVPSPHTPGISVEQSGHRPSIIRNEVTRKPLRPITTALHPGQ